MSKTTTFLSARCFLRLKIPLWSLSIRQNCSAEMDKLKSVSSTKKISEIIILICYDLTWTRERTLYIESNFLPRLNKNQASNTNGFFHHNGSRGHWRSWEIIIDSPACMGHEKRSKQTTIKKQNIKQQKKNWLDEAEYQERKPPTESNKRQYYEKPTQKTKKKKNLSKPVQTTEVAFQKTKKLTNKNQSIKTENRRNSSRMKQKTFGLQWPNLKKRIDKNESNGALWLHSRSVGRSHQLRFGW